MDVIFSRNYSLRVIGALGRYVPQIECEDCGGTGLDPEETIVNEVPIFAGLSILVPVEEVPCRYCSGRGWDYLWCPN